MASKPAQGSRHSAGGPALGTASVHGAGVQAQGLEQQERDDGLGVEVEKLLSSIETGLIEDKPEKVKEAAAALRQMDGEGVVLHAHGASCHLHVVLPLEELLHVALIACARISMHLILDSRMGPSPTECSSCCVVVMGPPHVPCIVPAGQTRFGEFDQHPIALSLQQGSVHHPSSCASSPHAAHAWCNRRRSGAGIGTDTGAMTAWWCRSVTFDKLQARSLLDHCRLRIAAAICSARCVAPQRLDLCKTIRCLLSCQ